MSATSVVIRAEDHTDKPDYAQIFDDADINGLGQAKGSCQTAGCRGCAPPDRLLYLADED